jgi:hypothetical protein
MYKIIPRLLLQPLMVQQLSGPFVISVKPDGTVNGSVLIGTHVSDDAFFNAGKHQQFYSSVPEIDRKPKADDGHQTREPGRSPQIAKGAKPSSR